MLIEEINEDDARQAIETLMDEEAEVAEDPTQNAMLSPSQAAKSAPEMEPEEWPLPEPELGTAAQSEVAQEMEYKGPDESEEEITDDSDRIAVPEPSADEEVEQSGIQYEDELEPEILPPQFPDEGPVPIPDWEEQSGEWGGNEIEDEEPQGDAADDMSWHHSLQNRSNS